MKHYVFSPALFDGPALFDTGFHAWGPNIIFAVTVLTNMWRMQLIKNGWQVETQSDGWQATTRRDS